jgi:L-ribulose-5-phosphate 3-epimerase
MTAPIAAHLSRRNFLAVSTAQASLVTASLVAASGTAVSASFAQEATVKHTAPPRRLLKTLKHGMLKVPGNLTEKFKAVKAAGFDGIELGGPGIDVAETKRAIEASGLVVDGSVCSTHWDIRHSSPDAAVRAQALADFQTALRQTHAVGGHTVLLVVGHGKDGTPEEVWKRSIDNIEKLLPLCAELGVVIAIENVWNQFLYQHDGPNNQSAEQFVKYVDEFDSPWVGMQFDIGNHWKYGNPDDWIRQLGRRIVKLDIKGFSRTADGFTDILEDDLPWAEVRQALDDIGFEGWVAAEVKGGDAERLAKIAGQMDRALNIG